MSNIVRPSVGLIGFAQIHSVINLGYQSKAESECQIVECWECGGPMISVSTHSSTRKGSGYSSRRDCLLCQEGDADGDYEPNEVAAYEDHYESEYQRANPQGDYLDSLCHNCQDVPAQDGTMLCHDCEVQIYGAEEAQAKAARREAAKLPYRLVAQ